MADKKRHKVEFGDFQTPASLAGEVCRLIAQTGFHPASILEPTCGSGSFLVACLQTFAAPRRVLGFEINAEYVAQARKSVAAVAPSHLSLEIRQADFFLTHWPEIIENLPQPLLVVGNPPWVTNAALGALSSNNVPAKSNLDSLRGIDALTGKSNFDISEWMLRKSLEWLNGKDGLLAMLCKTAVARKVLTFAWKNRLPISSASIHRLDAQKHFAAAVDACLLLIRTHPAGRSRECHVYGSLDAKSPAGVFGLRDGMLVADIHRYEKWKNLAGRGLKGWRSGIKHDAGKVFELRLENGKLVNGFGEHVNVEPEVLFPLLKSSDLAGHKAPSRYLIVPQKRMGADTTRLQTDAPKAWSYLMTHAHLLDKRKSSIYKRRPPFSIFGIGPYSFAPWKVAISGLYKKLDFILVSPFQGRPVVFDDTCYFFPCRSEEESRTLYDLVTSLPATEFLSAFIFWDAKRPVTARILNLLDLAALAQVLGQQNHVTRMLSERQIVKYTAEVHQPLLFREEVAKHFDE